MKELRCYKCNKVAIFLAVGSSIAKGTIVTCVDCIYIEKPKNPIDDLFKGMFG